MATPRLAGPAARPWLALGAVLAAGIGGCTRADLRAVGLDTGRAA
jgi:glutamine synthetase